MTKIHTPSGVFEMYLETLNHEKIELFYYSFNLNLRNKFILNKKPNLFSLLNRFTQRSFEYGIQCSLYSQLYNLNINVCIASMTILKPLSHIASMCILCLHKPFSFTIFCKQIFVWFQELLVGLFAVAFDTNFNLISNAVLACWLLFPTYMSTLFNVVISN